MSHTFYTVLTRDQIAERAAQDIPDGAYVNLGIGLPTKIAQYLPDDKDVFLHSESGDMARRNSDSNSCKTKKRRCKSSAEAITPAENSKQRKKLWKSVQCLWGQRSH